MTGRILTDEVIRQILTIRGTGKANMFDVAKVDKLASRRGFEELRSVLRNNKDEYAEFILFGKIA